MDANDPVSGPAPPAARTPRHFPAPRVSAIHFLAAVVLFLVATPFLESLESHRVIDALLITVVMLAGVLAVGGRARTLAWAALLVAPALAARWLSLAAPGLVHPAIAFVLALVFLGFVIWRLLVFVLSAPRVNVNVLCAGLAGYLTLALVWAAAYNVVSHLNPGAFSGPRVPLEGFNALYFSVVTITTMGYGDIVPVSNAARMLAMMEAMVGTLYIAVLISRLVAVYSAESRPLRA